MATRKPKDDDNVVRPQFSDAEKAEAAMQQQQDEDDAWAAAGPVGSTDKLGDVAKAALDADGTGPEQPALPETDSRKISFVGTSYDDLNIEGIAMGQEMTFLVRGRIVELGDKQLADKHVRPFGKLKVESVIPFED